MMVRLKEPVEDADPVGVQLLQKAMINTRQQEKIRHSCYAIGPSLGGYTQWVRWRAPTKKKQRKKKK